MSGVAPEFRRLDATARRARVLLLAAEDELPLPVSTTMRIPGCNMLADIFDALCDAHEAMLQRLPYTVPGLPPTDVAP